MMKKKSSFIVQASIFALILLVSDILSGLLKPYFPAPSSVIGMVILFTLLCFGVVKLENVEELGDSLLSKIGFLFVPSGISIVQYWDTMTQYGLAITTIIVITTIVLLGGTGWFAQAIMGRTGTATIEKLRQEIEDEKRGS